MSAPLFAASILAASLSPLLLAADPSSTAGDTRWNPQAAATYLDQRLAWWSQWPNSQRDHGTFCVSCHTAVPQALSRLTVSEKPETSEAERKLIASVTTRVRMWDEVSPYYSDQARGAGKTAESRGTEAVLNALVLASYSPSSEMMNPDLKLALNHLWAAQLKSGDGKGAWDWFQFHYAPWEGDSQFFGATVAAIAISATPESYRSAPEVQEGVQSLQEYLKSHSGSQKLLDRVMLLWASTKLPGLLSDAEQKAIFAEALAKQHADGGFSTTDFVGPWARVDKTPLETKSDGYATGLMALVLEDSRVALRDKQLRSALDWLAKNQEKSDGRWLAYSLNKNRDLSTDIGKFMSDAATAYASAALLRASR